MQCGNIPRTFKQESEVKNEALIAKLKNMVLSMMSLQSELRGQERAEMAVAIASVRKALELLK
jgi:hypothetical protein